MIIGMFIMYNDEHNRIAQTRETPTEIQGIAYARTWTGRWDCTTTSTLRTTGGDDPVKDMVRCDDGEVITLEADIPISTMSA